MIVRHAVARGNVDETGHIVEPPLARHCVVVAGAVHDLSGPVDPLTHLNAAFPDHELGECVVAESLEPGSAVLRDDEGRMLFASPRRGYRQPLGRVDVDARRLAWLEVLRARRHGVAHADR